MDHLLGLVVADHNKSLPYIAPDYEVKLGNWSASHTLPVRPVRAQVCVSKQPEKRGKLLLGNSECRTAVTLVGEGSQTGCACFALGGTLMNIECGFMAQMDPSYASPSLLWVCGDTG